jgi:hypothetical protein
MIFLTYLILILISLQGCSTQQEHKWVFYDLDRSNGSVYQGHTTTNADYDADRVLDAIKKTEVPDYLTKLDKPTIDEDDQLHFVVFGSMLDKASCQFVETPYSQPYDSKVVPQYKPKQPAPDLSAMERKAAPIRQAEQRFLGHQIVAQALDLYATRLEEAAAKAKQEATRGTRSRAPEAEAAAREARAARQRAQTASENLADAEEFFDLKQAEFQELKGELERKSIVCDLDVREKGSTKIDYTLVKSQKAKPEAITGEDILLKDSVLVHELYRFRILAGPVFSTLQKHSKHYQLSPNSAGQSVITATAAQDSPANFVLLLKAYHTKRDVLDPPSLFSNRWYETVNPIIGINLLDQPLQNFYAGFSFEPWSGFDIIGGVHWGKTQQLVNGFSQGQVTTQANGLTKERFSNGWFVGVAADIGIVTTWLKSAGSGVLTAIKTNP